MDPNNQNGEYNFFRQDVRRVIFNNILIIALLVALYFANQKYGFLGQLEKLF